MMKCALTIFSIFATMIFTLFMLTSEVRCCSDNLNDIITMMTQDSNFKQDPCYIQWQAKQDAKLSDLWRQRDELEKIIARSNRMEFENRQRERQNRYNSYKSPNTNVKEKKISSVWMLVGIFAGVTVVACCCCAAFKQTSDTQPVSGSAIPNTPQTNRNLNVSTSAMLSRNALGSQVTSNIFTQQCDQASSMSSVQYPFTLQQPETNVPLLPKGGLKRQNSLPSYEVAIRMPSAPLHK